MTDKPVQVRFGGLGGQGLVTLGAVLAAAGAKDGLNVSASQSYGSRARGGATRSDVILGREAVDFPHVIHPDLLVVLAEEAYGLYGPDVRPEAVVLFDSFFVHQTDMPGVRQAGLSATELAMNELNSKMAANFIMFGAFVGYTDAVSLKAVESAVAEVVRERFQQVNLQAFNIGLKLGRERLPEELGPWR